jgi:hypothetical protein
MQRIHRILDKMQDDRPNFNNADKQIIQNLFNKMVDLVSNNKQIFNQTRRAVREELEEGIVDTADYKVDSSGRKYKAHRTKVGDTAPQVGDDPDAIKEEAIQLDEGKEPPFVLVLKRKAIRVYPDGTKIALYYNDKLKRIFTVPYDTLDNNTIQAQQEEIEQVEEAVDAIGQLQKIKDTHQHGTVNHKDGSASKVDAQTAHAVLSVHKNLNDVNKKKFADMVARSSHHMQKAAEFSWKQMK